jgi:ATP synthase protein I
LEKEKSTEKQKPLNNFARFSGFGIQIVVTLCLAAWGGLKLDKYFELKVPVFLIVLLLSALGGTLYLFIKQVSSDK